MINVNQCQIGGIIGSDIIVHKAKTEEGQDYCRFNVGTKIYSGKDDKKKQTIAWVRCYAQGEIAQNISDECQNNTQIILTGQLMTRFFSNPNSDSQKEVTEVIVNDFQVVANGKNPVQDLSEQFAQSKPNIDITYDEEPSDVPF